MKNTRFALIMLLVSLILLSGCAPAPATPMAVDGTPANLIVITSEAPVLPTQDGGLVPPIVGAPVRPNASLLTVEVLSLTSNQDNPDFVIVHVLVSATAPVEGFDEYDPNLVGQEIDIKLVAGDAASLSAGDIVEMTVSYRGDEWGGGYYGNSPNYQR